MSQPKIIRRPDGTILIERFSPFRRVEHLLVIAGFTLLVLTGFPQKFYEASWAASVLQFFGGLDRARTLHRVVGIIFSVQAVIHIAIIAVGILSSKMRLTLLPTSQDFRDVFATLSYYFGYTKEHPRYPKFDYRQKFEYLGMVLGGLVMVFSGLALLYPGFITSFLPGQIIPAARLAHSNEALLAFCVLVVWHVYGSHLSPEVFPMDKSMFTGYLTLDYLKEHHNLEYRRLFPKEAAADDAAKAATGKEH
ncbi:MAG: hypothetical protein A2428_01745 [Bdellovibrionales bacterium RIFOXYC1_FULL_54_43]|nr:MAG: hypothetical protein A2428_01745 [Bdellovibrionales bacterium RIFOXYC1_FULL_54_43]OFZ78987.1 MAG: hypothetical protein A2603_10290 [Bdellovibrionales bacterium RIFOXYD1_FULL_55_31]